MSLASTVAALAAETHAVGYTYDAEDQGGPISPLIANVFLHYGFDLWMTRTFPGVLSGL